MTPQSPASSFLNFNEATELAAEAAAEPRKVSPWWAYRGQAVTRRAVRRQRKRDTRSVTKRYYKDIETAEREMNKVSTAEAVRRVRAWEAENERSAVIHLIDADLLPADTTSVDTFEVASLLGLLDEDTTDEATA